MVVEGSLVLAEVVVRDSQTVVARGSWFELDGLGVVIDGILILA